MSHTSVLESGVWSRLSGSDADAVLGIGADIGLPRNLPGASRTVIQQYWLDNWDSYFSHFSPSYNAGAIVMAAPTAASALCTAAIVFHETRARPLCFRGSAAQGSFPGAKPRRSADVWLSKASEVGLGLGQVTDVFHRAWLKAKNTTPMGDHLRQKFGGNSGCHVLPVVSLLIIAEQMAHLIIKYGSLEEALYRYAGANRAASAAEYAAKPSSLTAYTKLPFARAVHTAYGEHA